MITKRMRKFYFSKFNSVVYKSYILQKKLRSSNNSKEVEKYSFFKLRKLLNFVYRRNAFYHNLMYENGLHPSDFKSSSDLEKLPIIDKRVIKENFTDLISKDLPKEQFLECYTSGSTGEPFKFYNDLKNEIPELAASLILTKSSNGIDIYKKNNQLNIKAEPKGVNFYSLLNNNFFFKSIFSLPVSEVSSNNLEKIHACLLKGNIEILYGYSQTLFQLLSLLSLNKKESSIKSCICLGEPLFDYQRKHLEDNLGINVIINYGATECMRLGINSGQHNSYFLDLLNYNLQLDKIDNDGEGDLIVTNLNNYVFPFIRYKIGDRAKIYKNSRNIFPLINELNARSGNYLLKKNGDVISQHLITVFFEYRQLKIRKFKVSQKSDYNIEIEIETESSFKKQDIDVLRLDFLELIEDQNIIVQIKVVDRILPLVNGKYNFIENHLLEN